MLIMDAAPESHIRTPIPAYIIPSSAKNKWPGVEEDNIIPGQQNEAADSPQIFIVAARSAKSLSSLKRNLHQWLLLRGDKPGLLKDLAFTLSSRRTSMSWRQCFVSASHAELVTALESSKEVAHPSAADTRITYIFTGQGAQWYAMAHELLGFDSEFYSSIRRSEKILEHLGSSWRLIEELTKSKADSRVDEAEIGQPASTAVQIAIVDTFRQWHIEPFAVIGHSSGEIAAAYAAGALTQEMALKASFHRGYLSQLCNQRLPGRKGAMLVIGLGEEDVSNALFNLPNDRWRIACANSPTSTTISGDEDAMQEAEDTFHQLNVFCRRLRVDTAYHSHFMEAVAEDYSSTLHDLTDKPLSGKVRYISSVTAGDKTSNFGSQYWVDNLISPVRFSQALDHLVEDIAHIQTRAHDTFLEIGPHSALAGPIKDTLKNKTGLNWTYLPSLARNKNSLVTLLEVPTKLYEVGAKVDISEANRFKSTPLAHRVLSDLPRYPWDLSTQYWYEPRLSREQRLRKYAPHDILGIREFTASPYEPMWRSFISIDSLPWLKHHEVQGLLVFPGAGYICMAIEAMRQMVPDPTRIATYSLRSITFLEALIVPPSPARIELNITLKPQNANASTTASWYDFVVCSHDQKRDWSKHCSGSIQAIPKVEKEDVDEREIDIEANFLQRKFQEAKSSHDAEWDSEKLYNELKANGNKYGPSFALIEKIFFCGEYATGELRIPDVASLMPGGFLQEHIIHPTTLDAFLHVGIGILVKRAVQSGSVLASISEMTIASSIPSARHTRLSTISEVASVGSRDMVFNGCALPEKANCAPFVRFSGATLRTVTQDISSHVSRSSSDKVFKVEWNKDVDTLSTHTFSSVVEKEDMEFSSRVARKDQLLAQASLTYVRRCLQTITERNISPVDLHFDSLIQWMNKFSNEQHHNHMELTAEEDRIVAEEDWPALGVEGEALKRSGEHMIDMITGKVNPLALLLEGGLLYRLYNDESSQRCNAHLRAYLKLLIFKNPRLRVLEIGAGTGSTTIPLFNELSPDGARIFESYDFTDISSGFFEHAREKLSKWSGMIRYRRLDIGLDPGVQGFRDAEYDLIIATNVLHATPNIQKTVFNVRQLLKSPGRLALIEIVQLMPMMSMILGPLPGWWAGTSQQIYRL